MRVKPKECDFFSYHVIPNEVRRGISLLQDFSSRIPRSVEMTTCSLKFIKTKVNGMYPG
jgi:hypothetical protein